MCEVTICQCQQCAFRQRLDAEGRGMMIGQPQDSHMRAIRSLRGDCKDLMAERDQLKSENQRLRAGMKGDYDLDAWLEWTREAEGLRLRCERLEADKQTMAETHVLYTWLRKKCDQPSNNVVAVHMNIGHDWATVYDLDTDLRAMIEREEP